MFKVIVLACSVIVPDQCYEYHDTRGPYKSREKCISRAHEMGNAIAEINKGAIMPQKYRCKQLTPGRLTKW
jgi:hypothetical protein